jgi:hypothetical protein
VSDFAILADTTLEIEAILGRAEHHPDVTRVIDLVQKALVTQRYDIARAIRAEAAAYKRGELPTRNAAITFDGGLRRAARIAESGGRR